MQAQRDNDYDGAVLLLAFGGPNNLSEIEPFLKNIFCGRPVPPALVDDVRKRYEMIGGASPLTKITRAQAGALKDCLLRKGRNIDIYWAMRFWHPYISDVLTELEQKGLRRVLYLVMSPYCTPASTGGYDKAVRIWEDSALRHLIAIPATGWHVHPRYLDALIQTIRQGLAAFPAHCREQVPIIFTAHSLPEAQAKNDPYVDRLQETVKTIAERLGRTNYSLAFQSRGRGTDAWLQPGPEQVLEGLAQSGIAEVLLVPVGFVADHLETVYDLDIVLKNKAETMGVHLERSPSLNDNPLLIEALAETVLDSLKHSLL